jgi:2-keto-4-pentenoate hydratase/2-oxohepta-3-ene-1,7-dioic acid hydratase in catechol pathway
MRLISYESSYGPRIGVLPPPTGTALDDTFVPLPGPTMREFIGQGEAGLARAREALDSGTRLAVSSVKLLAPIPDPARNVFCLGWNYAEHSREAAAARGNLSPKEQKLPERPIFFTKTTTAVIGPEAIIPAHSHLTSQLDWEVELAIIIGKSGVNIPREEAMDHVFGYTVLNDVSARDIQVGHGGQFFKGKSLDGTCPMGPWIVPAYEILDPHALKLFCRVNGETKQEGSTTDLIFDIPTIIEWLSKGLTLLPGDIIATGTPAGVGFARNPPEFLKPGDIVECEVEGIGVLRNTISAV